MKFEALAEFIETNEASLKLGTNLFINQMPITPSPVGVLLKQPNAGAEIDPELPGRRRGRFQLVVRADDYKTGEAMSETLSLLLTLVETPMTGVLTRSLRPLHEPVSYMLSVGNKFEFSVNFFWIYDIVPQ